MHTVRDSFINLVLGCFLHYSDCLRLIRKWDETQKLISKRQIFMFNSYLLYLLTVMTWGANILPHIPNRMMNPMAVDLILVGATSLDIRYTMKRAFVDANLIMELRTMSHTYSVILVNSSNVRISRRAGK